MDFERASSISIKQNNPNWNIFITLDVHIDVYNSGPGQTILRNNLSEIRLSMDYDDVIEILEPLRGKIYSKDSFLAYAEDCVPNLGIGLVEKLMGLGFIVQSYFCPFSKLYSLISKSHISSSCSINRCVPNFINKGLFQSLPDPSPYAINIASRFPSCRSFEPYSMTMQQLSDCLLSCYGTIRPLKTLPTGIHRRSVPSAGGLYPSVVCIKLSDNDCLFIFDPNNHRIYETDLSLNNSAIKDIFRTPTIENASVLLMILTDLEYIGSKYGEKSYRFACIEAGHIAQNAIAWAESNQLSCLCIGAADDEILSNLFSPLDYLYSIAIGTSSRD
jgi:SagB-type dehydrogenase family enzyme